MFSDECDNDDDDDDEVKMFSGISVFNLLCINHFLNNK